MKALDQVFIDTGAEDEDINYAIAQYRVTETAEYRAIMEGSKVKFKNKFQEIVQKAKANKEARAVPIPPTPEE